MSVGTGEVIRPFFQAGRVTSNKEQRQDAFWILIKSPANK